MLFHSFAEAFIKGWDMRTRQLASQALCVDCFEGFFIGLYWFTLSSRSIKTFFSVPVTNDNKVHVERKKIENKVVV